MKVGEGFGGSAGVGEPGGAGMGWGFAVGVEVVGVGGVQLVRRSAAGNLEGDRKGRRMY